MLYLASCVPRRVLRPAPRLSHEQFHFSLMRYFWCVVPRLSTLVFPSEDEILYDWLLHCHL